MVNDSTIKDLFDESSRSEILTLPSYKNQKFTVDFSNEGDIETVYQGQGPVMPFAESEIFHSKIINWRRLTSKENNNKTVYEITLDVNGSNFKFKPGDTIGVIPRNSDSEVNEMLGLLHMSQEADTRYTLSADTSKKMRIPAHIPVQSTIRHVLTHCVDFRSVVKKLFLLELSHFATDATEMKALQYLCSKEGAGLYSQVILNKNINIIDILNIFKSCKPPIGTVLAYLPRLTPRPYSIINSANNNESIVKICFSVKMLDSKKRGLTSGWIEDMITRDNDLDVLINKLSISKSALNDKVPIYLRKNMGYRLPESMETPLLMIAAGTGVAPFIGFLEERLYAKERLALNLGDALLYFGCRNPDLDFIYKSELTEFQNKGVLTNLTMTFSRNESSALTYVQDAIKADAQKVVKFIKGGASVFVCGDLKTMAVQVRASLVYCFVICGATSDDAEATVAGMERNGTYLVDIWS